jgi:hypothetical protein
MISGFLRAVPVDVKRLWRSEGGGGNAGFWRANERIRVVLIVGKPFDVNVHKVASQAISMEASLEEIERCWDYDYEN